MNTDVRKFVEEMVELQEKKQNELNRRGKRANELLERSETVLSNQEQWEAYQKCVRHQQDRMIELVHDLFVIRSILSKVDLGDIK